MSDPVTNLQIEDVLSSIRKLVSEEVRAQTRPRPAREAEGMRDKLILTPAQRVNDETPEDDVMAEFGGAAAEEGDFDIDAFSRDLLADTDEEEVGDEPTDFAGETVSPSQALFHHTPLPGDDDYEDEGANAAPALDLSAFPSTPADDDAGETAFLPNEAEDLHDDLFDPDDPAATAAEDPEPEEEMAMIPSFLRSRGVRSMSQRIGELPATAAPSDVTETDQAMVWEDHLGAAPAPAPASAEEIEGDVWADRDALESAMAAPEALIDEEVLRDMVSEIVRQELQGALGERITRNVRKLVRREIQRALTAHDLL